MKIAAIDLDGTLLHSDSNMSDFSKKMIEKAAEQDILVIPTSGRSYRRCSTVRALPRLEKSEIELLKSTVMLQNPLCLAWMKALRAP